MSNIKAWECAIFIKKQKIDTKNSAEAELVGVDDTMTFAM